MSAGVLDEPTIRQVYSLRRVTLTWCREGTTRRTQDANALVRQALALPDMVERAWASTFDEIFAERIDDLDQAGNQLLAVFDVISVALAEVRDLASQVQSESGRAVDGLSEVDGAIDRIAQLRDRIFAHWPWFGEEEKAAAVAECERGEGTDADDTFARAAGVDVDTWRRRVEERRGQKP